MMILTPKINGDYYQSDSNRKKTIAVRVEQPYFLPYQLQQPLNHLVVLPRFNELHIRHQVLQFGY